ncbi:ABC transporter substrate-binding protein [Coprococcus comes]|uniref:ABC transporter substrate-binding protein n=1 Tax=Coprococcus comes TaxID=410072 RepID=UPI000AA9AD10|nr:ABC transporter substrate-binding protein [Coprococcus comes]
MSKNTEKIFFVKRNSKKDVKEDGKTYTFHLRKDAKWSDGSPVTAKDFEYSWRRTGWM